MKITRTPTRQLFSELDTGALFVFTKSTQLYVYMKVESLNDSFDHAVNLTNNRLAQVSSHSEVTELVGELVING